MIQVFGSWNYRTGLYHVDAFCTGNCRGEFYEIITPTSIDTIYDVSYLWERLAKRIRHLFDEYHIMKSEAIGL